MMKSIHERNLKEESKKGACPSTHGAAGYAPGSYIRDDGKVVCGWCGEALEPREEAIGDWMRRKR